MTKKRNKKIAILEALRDRPEVRVADIAKEFDVAASYVYNLRVKLRPITEAKKVLEQAIEDHSPQTDVDTVLDSRAKDYGKFKDSAALMQGIKRLLAEHAVRHDKTFADDQWEAIEMIVHKMARIVNGNPDKVDHWVDIAGYATLVADRLEGNAR